MNWSWRFSYVGVVTGMGGDVGGLGLAKEHSVLVFSP